MNPLPIDIVNDGCLVIAPIASDVASVETELTELQEDVDVKLVYKSLSLTDFWKQILAAKCPRLQKTGF